MDLLLCNISLTGNAVCISNIWAPGKYFLFLFQHVPHKLKKTNLPSPPDVVKWQINLFFYASILRYRGKAWEQKLKVIRIA